VLTRFVQWLRTAKASSESKQLIRLIKAFSALGVPTGRIKALRKALDSRKVDIPPASRPSIAAMIAGAVLDVPMEWRENRYGGLDPTPKSYVPLSEYDVPYVGNERDSMLLKLKRRLIQFPRFQIDTKNAVGDLSSSAAIEQFEQRLKGLKALGTPVWTILRDDETVMKIIEIGG